MTELFKLKTIESDDEVAVVDDSDTDDDTQSKPRSLKKNSNGSSKMKKFDSNFSFDFDDKSAMSSWTIDAAVKSKAKGKVSIEVTEEKIQEKRKKGKRNKSKTGVKSLDEENSSENIMKDALDKESDYVNADDSDLDSGENDSDSADSDSGGGFFEPAPKHVLHKSFAEMNLSRPILKAINELGFVRPTKVQVSTIPVALLGKDICACATTGSGKTAAFMLPILERLLYKPKQSSASRVLILVPTRELAIQVHSVAESLAKHLSVDICLAAGGLDLKAQEAALRKSPDIIIATPGRLIDHLHNAPSFDLQTIEVLIIDEADRMLEEHFQDQLNEIIRLCPRGRQTMLFSATMTDEVQALVSLSLNRPVRLFVDQNTDVAASLHQEFVRIRPNRESDRLAIVTALCCRSFQDHCLIFVQTKHLAHKLRILLGLLGLNATELHGNLTQLQRLEALEKFKNASVDFMVATDLAARGLDISGVKTVISFNLPTTLKSYIHRVGRTARAGKAGRSITLVGEKERKMLKDVVKSAKVPVKHRIIPPDVIEKYREKIVELEPDVKDILKEEDEEKEMRVAEMQMKKAENLVVHHDEIMSRPARTFLKLKPEGKQKTSKSAKGMTEEEKEMRKDQAFHKRLAKREKRPKRIRAFQEDGDGPGFNRGGKKKKLDPPIRPGKSFEHDLTDTSKKNVKKLRSQQFVPKKKKSGGFKSKMKHKRR